MLQRACDPMGCDPNLPVWRRKGWYLEHDPRQHEVPLMRIARHTDVQDIDVHKLPFAVSEHVTNFCYNPDLQVSPSCLQITMPVIGFMRCAHQLQLSKGCAVTPYVEVVAINNSANMCQLSGSVSRGWAPVGAHQQYAELLTGVLSANARACTE